MRFVGNFSSLTLCLLLAAACSKSEPAPQKTEAAPPAAPTPTPAPTPVAARSPASEARSLFKSRCSVCHGNEGKGDGPGAAALTPKPRNYTDAEWQKSIKDEEIAQIIVKGGAAVGKSTAMPPNPDLEGKAEVVAELVKYVRSFAQ